MSKECIVCEKKRKSGNQVSHSHRKSRRAWNANLQKVSYVNEDGTTGSGYVCTRCLRSNKITRA